MSADVYVPGPYRDVILVGRSLQVPDANDRHKQRELYARVKDIRPVSWRPELIQQRIRAAFQSHPHLVALRTDIRRCFERFPQERVRAKIQGLPIDGDLKESLQNVLTPVKTGLPTGSPLSPWLAELVLEEVDQAFASAPWYFRYSDDVCVLGQQAECEAAQALLEKTLADLGMELNREKTRIVPQSGLTFLGRCYRQLADSLLLEVDLGGETFHLPNDRQVILRVNRAGKPYVEENIADTAGRRIIYSLSCLFNKLSQQPTPYLLEMLMLKPVCEEPTLQQIIAQPESILDSGTPHALHGKIFLHYVGQVKGRVKPNAPLPIGAAGEVYRWLYLAKNLMETGKLIESYREIEAEWGQLAEALQNGDYAPYHKRIKALFKEEFALRGGQSVLPESKPILELVE